MIILKPYKLDREFEYKVIYEDNIYIAGSKKVRMDEEGIISGNLFLDKLIKTQKEVKAPLLLEVYNTQTITKEKRSKILRLKNIILADPDWGIESSLDNFLKNLDLTLKSRGNEADLDKMNYYFGKVHMHYEKIYS